MFQTTLLNNEVSSAEITQPEPKPMAFGGESFSFYDLAAEHRASTPDRIGLDISAKPITFSACSPLEYQASPVVDCRNKNNKAQKCTCKGQCTEFRCGCRKSGNIYTAKCICRGKCIK